MNKLCCYAKPRDFKCTTVSHPSKAPETGLAAGGIATPPHALVKTSRRHGQTHKHPGTQCHPRQLGHRFAATSLPASALPRLHLRNSDRQRLWDVRMGREALAAALSQVGRRVTTCLSQVFCMGFGARSADTGTAVFLNGEKCSPLMAVPQKMLQFATS